MEKIENASKWKLSEGYHYDERIKIMISLIDLNKISSIIDLGCGKQDLKKYLPSHIRYSGYDAYKLCDTTKVIDLNKDIIIEKADCVFISGVIEFLYNIDNLLQNLKRITPMFIGSYNFYEDVKIRNEMWANAFTKDILYKKLSGGGIIDRILHRRFKLVKEFKMPQNTGYTDTIFIYKK